jgi:TOTE conflict system, Archaeo-Eukaryotic Primase domain
MTLFAGFDGAHGTHGEPKRDGLKWEIKSTAQTLRQPPTLERWRAHLEGKRPLGVIPVRADATCVWGSGDIDEYDVDLLEIVRESRRRKFPLVPCRSKSGGLHMFLFAASAVPAELVRRALRTMMASIGHARCEIFPKQSQILADRGDLGSWMVMPYFGDTFGGKLREQVGLKETGAEMTADEFLRVAEAARVTEDQLTRLAELGEERPARDGEPKKKREPFGDGPPCLQILAKRGFPEGGRNKALFHMGLYYLRSEPADWQERLAESNLRYMKPPLGAEEVAGVVRSLEKKGGEYQYLCKEEPMCSHCDSAKCRGRKYGVGSGGDFPEIEGLRMLDTEPPIWFVEIKGVTITCGTEELQDYRTFHRLCMSKLRMTFGPVKQQTWYSILGQAMAAMPPPMPAPPEASFQEQFRELLEEFCTDRASGEHREEILMGRPVLEDGHYFFRVKDLMSFLKRENVRDFTKGQVIHRIQKMGGDNGQWNIKGTGARWMSVPASLLQVKPEIATPTQRQEEII